LQSLQSWNSQLNRVANAIISEALHPNHLTYMRFIAIPPLILFNYFIFRGIGLGYLSGGLVEGRGLISGN